MKITHKLSRTQKISQVGSNNSLYCEIKKKLNKKKAKITKPALAFKGYTSSSNVKILNFFNLELQLKGTESAIKNKIKKILTELKGFKFVTTLVLKFKKIENNDKTKHDTFYSNQKQLLMKLKFDVFKSVYTTIVSKHVKLFRKKFRLNYF